MRTIFLFAFLFVINNSLLAQEKPTVVNVDGSGNSCEEAIKDALRNAINQVSNTFIYSNTQIRNDLLVSDDISMLTSGNVLSRHETKPCYNKNNQKAISLSVSVSQTELKNFIEGKGKSVAISGELIKQKLDQDKASTTAEPSMVNSIILELNELSKDCFDYDINIEKIFINKQTCTLPANISIKTNKNFYNIFSKLSEEIKKISINSNDQNFRKETLRLLNYKIKLNTTEYFLRDEKSIIAINNFYKTLIDKMNNFIVVDDCFTELKMSDSKFNLLLNEDLSFPEAGYLVKSIKGKYIASIDEIGSLHRINIFTRYKLEEYKNGKTKSGDLALLKYSETNPTDFADLENNLKDSFEELANDKENGKIKLNYYFSFTEDGVNNSSIKDIEISNKTFRQNIENSISQTKLNPSKLCGNYLKTSDNLNLNFNWKTYNSNYAFIKGRESEYSSYFTINRMPYGTYEIKIKEKELNSRIFKDVSITNFITRGPSSSLYSFIIPGWGTRHVTYNQESGWGKFWSVVIPLTLSVVCESISNSNYTKYKESNTKQLAEDYYNKANLFHQGSLGMAGVSFGFYVAEIISVIKKGNRNNLINNKIKNTNENNINIIQVQPLSLN